MSKRDGYLLLVEDDPDLRFIESEILQTEGYRVRTAADGLEALEVLRQEPQPPVLVLLDLRMPRMNGWDLAARMREEPAWRDIPVIVVAAHYAIAAEAAALGARGWLHKPVSIEALLREVSAVYDASTDEVA